MGQGYRRPTDGKAAGFTLVELLVVIGIIAVMAAAAVPNIAGYVRASRINAAQTEVANALQKARNKAISSNTQFGVSFVVESTSTYWIHVEDPMIATASSAATTGRQPLNTSTPNALLSTRFVLDPRVRFAIAANSCPGFTDAGNQEAVRFDRYGVRSFPDTSPPTSNPAEAAIGGSSTLANGFVITNSSAEAAICLVDTQTGLRRRIIIAPGGRIRKE